MASPGLSRTGFHAQQDTLIARPVATWREDTEYTYKFENFFHPFVGELIQRLNHESLEGMLDPTFHQQLTTDFFDEFYSSLTTDVIKVQHFPKDIDVRNGGPYANYNWELLFHIPLTIAVHLSKNQRFAEALRWFHFIFDPTCTDTSIPTPARFWKFLRFRQAGTVTPLDQLLTLLSKTDLTVAEEELKQSILDGYEKIRNDPFQPHAVARTRPLAYQYHVVMRYLDNLIAWADSLFRQDTVESINEATQRYVLAANLLGARPQRIPERGTARARTFAQLKAQGLDALGNALVELEGNFPFNLAVPQSEDADPDAPAPLFGIGRTLYFCIPRNERMLSYWDTVADRLFKIRHCMNIEGVVRQLALFDPPLDPGMLVKAAAAGIDVSAILSGLNQPNGPVRASLLMQKALELCEQVRALGAGLLTAIEKNDSEQLARLRQSQELTIQQMTQDVQFLQWKQAEESTEALLRGRAGALERYRYYQRLLDLTPDDTAAPDTLPLDRRELTEENFAEAYEELVGKYEKTLQPTAYPPLELKEEGRLALHVGEYDDLNGHADRALAARVSAAGAEVVRACLALIPTFHLKAAYWGIGADARVGGGSPLSAAGTAVTTGFNIWGDIEEWQGTSSTKTASYTRRADDWILQSNLAARELGQMGRQLLGSLIAEQMARHQYTTVQKQIEHSKAVDQFYRDKFSSEELYTWMQGELSRLYYEYYRSAFDAARKAEQAMKRELMRPEVDATDYVKFNYWDGGRKGLLSGEALCLDLKRMELAYLENNKRELELTKHVSLRQLDPLALLALKATGSCTVTIPEWLYDLDGAGQYIRRIKTVAVSIPSIIGPYTSVACTLSLLRSSVRKTSVPKDGEYARQGSEDDRFVDYAGTIQSIVTSTATFDSGLFETNLRDDRLLPFEGAGAISTWKLDLPKDYPTFDYVTISDVILHVRYTARLGVNPTSVKTALDALFQDAGQSGLTLLFSLRHEFVDQWSKFLSGDAFTASIRKDYFPYFTQGKTITVTGLELWNGKNVAQHHLLGDAAAWQAATDGLAGPGRFDVLSAPTAVLARSADAQVFLVVRYTL